MEEEQGEEDKLKELIREALTMQIETQKKRKSRRELDNTLSGVLQEFLNSFIVLGYNFNGEPIVIKSAPTVQSNEALMSLLIKVFSREIGYTGEQ